MALFGSKKKKEAPIRQLYDGNSGMPMSGMAGEGGGQEPPAPAAQSQGTVHVEAPATMPQGQEVIHVEAPAIMTQEQENTQAKAYAEAEQAQGTMYKEVPVTMPLGQERTQSEKAAQAQIYARVTQNQEMKHKEAYTTMHQEQIMTQGEEAAQNRSNERLEEQDELLNRVLDYFIANEGKLLGKMQESRTEEDREHYKGEVMKRAGEQFKTYGLKGAALEEMLEHFRHYMWGYYILEPLIEDTTVFDIKCYDDRRIRIKRMGKRMDAPKDIRFDSPADYSRFVRMVATKNSINLSVINALATFTDKESSPDFILRFDISTEFINSSGYPCVHIRKLPKHKYSLEDLVGLGFLTTEQSEYLRDKAANSGGILFTGAGGSGKTNLMNALLEEVPHDSSGLVIQENEELFSVTHPDMSFQHVIATNGEGKISYSLEDLARQGLLNDIDLFVIGEIKGNEAASFAMCSYTGAHAWCSCHGKNETEAIYKLADYVKRATDYSLEDSLRMLAGLKVICYIKDFHLEGVSEIKGWDYEKNTLRIEKKVFTPDAPDKGGSPCHDDLSQYIL